MNYLGLASAGLSALGQSAAALTKYQNKVDEKADAYEAAQESIMSQSSGATDFRQLANDFNNLQWSNFNPTVEDFMGSDAQNALGIMSNTLGASLNGMQASGSAWGALMGLPVLGAELGGFFGAKNSAQDKIESIKAENERINKALTERYNYRASAISQNNLNDALLNLMAKGGKLRLGMDFTNGVRFIEEGGSHEQNPLGGVPQGVAMDGLFNLVEEGEVIYDDYVFSKRLNVPDADKEKLGLKKDKDYTFAEAAEFMQRESEERPNDYYSKNTLKEMMGRLQGSQEGLKQKQEESKIRRALSKMSPEEKMTLLAMATQGQQPQFARGGHLFALGDKLNWSYPSALPDTQTAFTEGLFSDLNNRWQQAGINAGINVFDTTKPLTVPELSYNSMIEGESRNAGKQLSEQLSNNTSLGNSNQGFSWGQALRAAPIFGSALGALSAFMDKPNYSNIARAERAMASVPRVSAGTVGQRLTYNPVDINYIAASMNNQAIGARRATVEGSLGNSAAAIGQLMALNYGSQTALGNALIQAQKENADRKAQVAGFNRETDSFNIQNSLRAAMQNQEMDARRAYFLMQTGQLRDQELARIQANRSAALTNLFQNIGNYGQDLIAREQVDAGIKSGVFGNLGDNEADYRRALGMKFAAKKGGNLYIVKKGGKHA